MTKYGIGQPVLRFEDPRLLRGQGRFINDVNLPGQAHAVFVRTPHAHARIGGVDTRAAQARPACWRSSPRPMWRPMGSARCAVNLPRKRPDGSPMFYAPHPGLARDEVRYVGDPVAMVVAETASRGARRGRAGGGRLRAAGSVTDTAQVLVPGAPAVWAACPDNISHIFEAGTMRRPTRRLPGPRMSSTALRHHARPCPVHGAARRVRRIRSGRGSLDALCRRAVSAPRAQHAGAQRVQGAGEQDAGRSPAMSAAASAPRAGNTRAPPGAVGGAQARRPVKWRCERSEAIMADEHGRDNVGEIELALDEDGKFLGAAAAHAGQCRRLYRLRPQSAVAVRPDRHADRRVYAIPAAYTQLIGGAVQHQPDRALSRRGPARGDLPDRAPDRSRGATNSASTASSCAAATSCRPEQMPYKTPLGQVYDCGDVRTQHGHGARGSPISPASPRA